MPPNRQDRNTGFVYTPSGTQAAFRGQPITFTTENLEEAMLRMRESLANDRTNVNNKNMKEILKQRHLTKSERRALHKPAKDWEETSRGDKLRSACTIEISDILDKHKVKVIK
jgi:hypothetical protein